MKELFTHFEGKVVYYCEAIVKQYEKIKEENKEQEKSYLSEDKEYLINQMNQVKRYIRDSIPNCNDNDDINRLQKENNDLLLRIMKLREENENLKRERK